MIPDTQCKPGVPIQHLGWAGQYAGEKRPDTIIHLGDHWDMKSLCSYDLADNPKDYHAQLYTDDLDAGDRALDLFETKLSKARGYKPRKIMLGGNHEERADRLLRLEPRLVGAIRRPSEYAIKLGWEVIPFLQVIEVDGVLYCHYFCRGPGGTVTNAKQGAPSAKAQVTREMRSCTAGHKQGLDVHIQPTSHGMMRGVIAGSFYQHEEDYLSPQGTQYWRGVLIKHEVNNGDYNLMEVSLKYLQRRYEG